MPVSDLFQRLNFNEFTDFPFVYQLVNLSVSGRIAQNVTDEHLSAVFLLRAQKLFAFFLFVGNRLFEQNVIPQFERLDALADVVSV